MEASNLRIITSKEQLPNQKDFVMLIKAEWCPHCQQEIPVLNAKCGKNPKTACYVVDSENPNVNNILQSVTGQNLRAFPTNVFCKYDPNTKKHACKVVEGGLNPISLDAQYQNNKLL